MNFSIPEAKSYFQEISEILKEQKIKAPPHISRVVFTQAFCLQESLVKIALNDEFQLGAQNCYFEEKGAFTGELSPTSLKRSGIEWVLVGHSERRQFFSETPETAAKRAVAALQNGLHVVFCIGETLKERESNQTQMVLQNQLTPLFEKVKSFNPSDIYRLLSIAYEPVWAIGTGKTATTLQASEAHTFIRVLLEKNLGQAVSNKIPLLYGGSVTPQNSRELLSQHEIDGVLVGGASLKPESFSQILASV